MGEADDLLECIVPDVLLQHLTATVNAEAMQTVELHGDVVGNGRVSLLNLIGVANRAVVQRDVVTALLTPDLACRQLESSRQTLHFLFHLDVTALPTSLLILVLEGVEHSGLFHVESTS